ncbi:uncharacterized protein LOC133217143 [Neopsephotus bourkii]|uniref:uncharacterized protein LOC133217143 n=1 Tax=Neopsephotus bourkii TaxID=309878 RepID=UPI002AA58343|nr:uncharacterized protein LOC133217143 [Neopsephotus bourkii]
MSLSPCCQPLSSSPPFQKHYFPIDYMVQVQYKEVLRPSNITCLRNRTVSEVALQYLWFHVSSQAVLRIHEVLPEKHPSWKYTQELCQLLDALGKEYSKYWQVGRPCPLPPPPTPALSTNSHVALHTPCGAAGYTRCLFTQACMVHGHSCGVHSHTTCAVGTCTHGCEHPLPAWGSWRDGMDGLLGAEVGTWGAGPWDSMPNI